jgi:hypothetical protein
MGKRLRSPMAGWLTVIILCVSVWEIEMARFARMYAPFQAVFAWYVVFYLRYTGDARRRGLVGMIALSVLGALTWEGGVVLGVANLWAVVLAHEEGRLKAAEWGRLAGLFALLMVLYFVGTNDFREAGEPPAAQITAQAEPAPRTGIAETALSGAVGAPAGLATGLVGAAVLPLMAHRGWACGWLLALALAAAALRWIASYRRRWLSGAGLCLVLAAAALHLFTLAFGTVALLLLSGLIDRRELAARRAWPFLAALGAFLVFWLAFDHWVGGIPNEAVDRAAIGAAVQPVGQHLFGFPDVYDALIRPWARTLPVLTLGMGTALGYLFLREIGSGRRDSATVLLSLLVVMVLLVGMTPAPRIETRYTFFLYPLMTALAVAALLELAQRIPALRRAPLAVSAAVPLICFGATEDFQPWHIAAIDSAEVNFRIGMSPVRAAHYYPRNDMRSAGEWLAAHREPGDAVITDIPNLAQYYGDFDYFFLDGEDNRYEAYLCQDGRTDRWTDHPLLHTVQALEPVVMSRRRVWVSVYPDTERYLAKAARAEGWSVQHVWSTNRGNVDVLLITPLR